LPKNILGDSLSRPERACQAPTVGVPPPTLRAGITSPSISLPAALSDPGRVQETLHNGRSGAALVAHARFHLPERWSSSVRRPLVRALVDRADLELFFVELFGRQNLIGLFERPPSMLDSRTSFGPPSNFSGFCLPFAPANLTMTGFGNPTICLP